MSERLCVVMPVYNERAAIGSVLEKWDSALKRLGIDYEIRPYNDGSRDDSLEVMRQVASQLGARINVKDKPNGGHGNTILTGYREAAADGFDWIFQIDSDDEMGPERFNELWSHRSDYDFLVGIRDGRVQALPRKVISFVSRLCVKLFYGKSIWDVNTPYRLMRTSVFKPFYEAIPLTTFAPNVILSGLAARHKLRCFETRVPQHDRTTGEVSIKKWKLLKAAAKSFWQTILFAMTSSNLVLGLRNNATIIFCLIVTFLAASLVVASNPIYDFSPHDSSVFEYIGLGMVKGLVPYKDMFDHKGPLLYLLNYLGVTICGGVVGIWFLIVALRCMAISVIGYALSKVFSAKVVIVTLICFLCFMVYCDSSGNMTEAYATILILLNLAAVIPAVLEGHISKRTCFVSGLTFGGIALLRPNMFGISGAVAIWVILESFRLKSLRTLIESVLIGLCGAVIAIAPFVLYYWGKGALWDLYDCYIRFNFAYTFGPHHVGFKFGIGMVGALTFLLIGVLAYVHNGNSKSMRRLLLFNLIFQLVSICFVLTRTVHLHYFLPIIPSCLIPLAWLIARFKNKKCVIFLLPVLLCLPVGAARLYVKASEVRRIVMRHEYSKLFTRQCLRISEKEDILNLKPQIDDLHSVWVLGEPYVYHVLNADTGEKYFFQPPVRQYCGVSIDDAIIESIEKQNNKFVIIAPNNPDKALRPWQEILETRYTRIAISGKYQLWKRK